tara:strand:+ start:19978 stop:20415 length:438 start_codon:yes stop_codon:yes gene_type:complete
MDPLSALAAFNAACAVIRTATQNGSDILHVFHGIGDALKHKQQIEDHIKKNPDHASDLELYAAHAKATEEWEAIVTQLKWMGHWDKFCAWRREQRETEKRARLAAVRKQQAKIQMYKDAGIVVTGVFVCLLIIGIFIYVIRELKP